MCITVKDNEVSIKMQKIFMLVQKIIYFIKALIKHRTYKAINLIRKENSSKGVTGNKVTFHFSGMLDGPLVFYCLY